MANPPPPYADITGISRTVMKDNAQESIVNYNGNARPGEIVADLTTDPPTMYVGNNIGQLTLLAEAGSYGNIQVKAFLEAGQAGNIIPNGNAVYTLGNATNQWESLYVSNSTIYINNVPVGLDANNVLTVNNEAILSNGSDTSISTTGNITVGAILTDGYFYANGAPFAGGGGNATLPLANGTSNFNIATANGNATITVDDSPTWTFDTTGNVTTAGNIILPGNQAVWGYNAGALTVTANVQTDLSGISINAETDTYVYANANVVIETNTGSSILDWTFDTTGNLTTPGSGGDIVMSGGNISNVGNIELSLGSVIGEGPSPTGVGEAVTITPANGSDANQKLNIYPTVAEGNHLHLTSGNLQVTDLFLGDDTQYIRTATDGSMVIGTNGGPGAIGGNTWTFDASGQTIFPVLDTARGDTNSGNLTGPTMSMGTPGYQELVITTPNGDDAGIASQRLVINPGKGADGTSGEGGDIYLWAGRGGNGDGTTGGGSGGDIKIRGGQGMSGNDGGYIRMEGGNSNGDAGAAGWIEITAGETNGGPEGYVTITGGYNGTGSGGNVTLTGGYGSTNGGNVVITGGSTGGEVGNIYLQTKTFLPVNYTGPGPGEAAWVKGTRTNIGGLDKATSAAYEISANLTPTLCYVASDTAVQSARITFVVQSNGTAANWEQFDVAVVANGSDAYVSVSNKVRSNISIDWTTVTANTSASIINVYLALPAGQTIGYVNYSATEFNLMVD